jgi:putative heme-binding domain-containing protein
MRHRPWVIGLAGALGLASSAGAAPSSAELEQAGNLFAISCSSSFCHGEAGIGGRGPTLRNRDLPPDFIRMTVMEGRSGTAMPSFKDSLTPQELDMIVGYVMTLSPNNHATGGAAAATPPAAPPAPQSAQAQRGMALFFDRSRANGCSACHSYHDRGGPIGPDLSGLAARTPSEIFSAMTKPKPGNQAYPAFTTTLSDGRTITGILAKQDVTGYKLYDLSTTPPVLRSFYAADGAKLGAPSGGVPYVHDLAGLSKDDLASLVAFLKSADGGPDKAVTQADLVQP